MKLVIDFFSNKYIIVPVFAWFLAQIIKIIIVVITEKRLDFRRLVGSGGMPSSHSAFIVSLSTVLAKNYGLNSAEFGIAFAISMIVMYDAAGVRRAAGRHAKILNEIVYSNNHKINLEGKLKELLGHSPFEVTVGALLGVVLGLYLG